MRPMILAALLAACTPAAEEPPAAPPAPSAWILSGDDSFINAHYAAPGAEPSARVTCNRFSERISLAFAHPGARPSRVRIITAAHAIDLPASPTVQGGAPGVHTGVERGDQQLAPLEAPQESFAVEAGGETITLPWDVSIARALRSCRVRA